MAAKKKHDPFFTHLWDELTNAKILQSEGLANWMDVPAKIQAQFIDAAHRAMNAALGAPAPKRKAAKRTAKKAPKAKTKAKAKTKTKAKAKTKRAKAG